MATITVQKQLSGTTIKSVATVTERSRSGTSVVLDLTFKTNLVSSSGFIGTGYDIKGTVTAYGVSKTVTLKSTSSSWNDTSIHTTTSTMSITVPATTTSITVGYKIKHDGETATGTSTTLTLSKVLAKVTKVTSFTDTTNPTMTFTNPAGFKIRPYLAFYEKSGASRLLLLRPSGMSSTGAYLTSPYTWDLTDAQRKEIRDVLKNRTTAYVAVGLETYDGSTYINYSSIGTTFTNVLKPPIFSDFEFKDVNEQTIALTGNDNKIIKGYSTLRITINSNNKAIAQNEASMSYYQINGVQYPYAEEFVQDIRNWSNNSVEVYAVDSRGITTKVSKTSGTDFEMIEYTPLSKGTISLKRENNIEELTNLAYDGSFWNNNFGSVSNTLNATYKYKISDTSEYADGTTTINPVIDGNNFEFNNYIKGDGEENGFLIQNSYQVEVIIKDALSETTYNAILSSGIPAIAVYKNNIAIHGKYDEYLGGTQVNGDLFLNSQRIVEPSIVQITLTEDVGDFSTDYNYFHPFFITTDTNDVITVGDKLTYFKRNLKYGDRTGTAPVYGVQVGKGVSYVSVKPNIRYLNNETSTYSVSTIIVRRRNDVEERVAGASETIVSSGRHTSTPQYIVDVQEGDLLYVLSHKATKTADIEVISTNGNTNISFMVVN